MNVLDIILLLCFVPAIIFGIKKGFIAQVIAIISIVVGLWLSFQFSDLVSGWISDLIGTSSPIVRIIAFVIILVLVAAGFALLGKLLEATIKIIMLGWLNKLLGVIFSIVKYTLILGAVLIAFDWVNNELNIINGSYLDKSLLYRPFLNIANAVFPYFQGLFS